MIVPFGNLIFVRRWRIKDDDDVDVISIGDDDISGGENVISEDDGVISEGDVESSIVEAASRTTAAEDELFSSLAYSTDTEDHGEMLSQPSSSKAG